GASGGWGGGGRTASALPAGAGSAKPRLKGGPGAAIKFIVSARLKLPCMPCPCWSPVSAISTVHSTGASQPVVNERKLTTMDGVGVTARPDRLIASAGTVPALRPTPAPPTLPLPY